MKGSAVVTIGVGRRSVGRDDGPYVSLRAQEVLGA